MCQVWDEISVSYKGYKTQKQNTQVR